MGRITGPGGKVERFQRRARDGGSMKRKDPCRRNLWPMRPWRSANLVPHLGSWRCDEIAFVVPSMVSDVQLSRPRNVYCKNTRVLCYGVSAHWLLGSLPACEGLRDNFAPPRILPDARALAPNGPPIGARFFFAGCPSGTISVVGTESHLNKTCSHLTPSSSATLLPKNQGRRTGDDGAHSKR